MKIFRHLAEARKARTLPKIGRTVVNYSANPSTPLSELDQWEWSYTVTVGCTLTGPEDAREHMAEQAKRMIARELYGELEGDIRDAIEAAHEEAYRPHDDPLMRTLETMLLKVRGEVY